MTNPELVRIVVENQDGVLVTAEVNSVLYRSPGTRVVATTLEVMNLNAGITVITGIGTKWKSRNGLEGRIFMPVFTELKSGDRFRITLDHYRAVLEHLHFSLTRPSQTEAVPSLLIRAVTPHGLTVLQSEAEPKRRPFEGDSVFELPGSPAVDLES